MNTSSHSNRTVLRAASTAAAALVLAGSSAAKANDRFATLEQILGSDELVRACIPAPGSRIRVYVGPTFKSEHQPLARALLNQLRQSFGPEVAPGKVSRPWRDVVGCAAHPTSLTPDETEIHITPYRAAESRFSKATMVVLSGETCRETELRVGHLPQACRPPQEFSLKPRKVPYVIPSVKDSGLARHSGDGRTGHQAARRYSYAMLGVAGGLYGAASVARIIHIASDISSTRSMEGAGYISWATGSLAIGFSAAAGSYLGSTGTLRLKGRTSVALGAVGGLLVAAGTFMGIWLRLTESDGYPVGLLYSNTFNVVGAGMLGVSLSSRKESRFAVNATGVSGRF